MEELLERINHPEEVLDAEVRETDDDLAHHAGLHQTMKKLSHRARFRTSS